MSVNGLCNPPQESMNWSKELPTEYEYEFDPTILMHQRREMAYR